MPETPSNSPETRARDWWRTSVSDAEGDRGVRAELRRAHSPLDAVSIPAALALARRLGRIPEPGAQPWKQRGFERALGLAVVLSFVRTDTPMPLLRSLGWAQFPYDKRESDVTDGRPILSELRFKRLLQTDGEDELIAAFSRLIKLARGETDVANLARIFLRWDEDRTKRDLALTYFNANARGLDAHD
jgi:CRISPR type I-E-associated protein CasB/Cse2